MAMIVATALYRHTRLILTFTVAVALSTVAANSHGLTLITWNIASDQAKIDTIISRLRELSSVDFYGLTEVAPRWVPAIENYFSSLATPLDLIVSEGGRNDRLAIAYDKSKYELVTHFALDEVNIGGRVRPALIGLFRDRATSTEFYFIVNHLYRSDGGARLVQSKLLNMWIRKRDIPTIAVGDYNYDWKASYGIKKYDPGFDMLTADGVLKWVVPAKLVKTHCARHNTIVDFVFVSRHFSLFEQQSRIEMDEPSYCESQSHGDSDHRPVFAEVSFSAQ
jgi:endonuclease/exonuclease/phosphatase family metal-dependent hydrolase